MCAKYSLPPFDWLKLSHHLVSGESTLHEVTLFEARSRIFLPTAESCAALFCCRLAIRASSLGWLVGNNFQCVSFIRYSNEKSELKTHNWNIGVHIFCLDTFIWLVGKFCPMSSSLTVGCLPSWILTLWHENIETFKDVSLDHRAWKSSLKCASKKTRTI